MARYLIIRNSDGLVTNAVEWNGDPSHWQAPAEHTARREDAGVGNIGDTWNGSIYVKAPIIVPPEQKLSALIDILKSKVAFLSDEEKARLNKAE